MSFSPERGVCVCEKTYFLVRSFFKISRCKASMPTRGTDSPPPVFLHAPAASCAFYPIPPFGAPGFCEPLVGGRHPRTHQTRKKKRAPSLRPRRGGAQGFMGTYRGCAGPPPSNSRKGGGSPPPLLEINMNITKNEIEYLFDQIWN